MKNLTDKEITNVILDEHKLSASAMTTLVLESACPTLRSDATQILTRTFDHQKQIFDIMSQKGWYETQPANQQDLTKAKQTYSNISGGYSL